MPYRAGLADLVTILVLLLLSACSGTLSEAEATSIAELGPTVTPPFAGPAMFRGGPERQGVYETNGPLWAPEEAWRFKTPGYVSGFAVVSQGTVFFGAGTDTPTSEHYFYAVDAQTGREKWRFATGGRVFSQPAVSDGVVYFGSENGRFYAFDAATGEERWRFRARGAAWSSPAVVHGVVYFTARDGNLYALDAGTGEERWRFELFDRRYSRQWDWGSGFSPAVHDKTVYSASLDGHLYAVDSATGEERWRFKTKDAVRATPAVADGVVYFGGGNDWHLHALDADTGTEKWRFKTRYAVRSSPAVIDNTVMFTSPDLHLYAVDARTGQQRWKTQVGHDSGPPVIARNRSLVYVAAWDADSVQAYALDVDSGTIWWQTKIEDGEVGFVTISDGRMYIGGQDGRASSLIALE